MFRYIINADKEAKEEGKHFHMIGLVATLINVAMYASPIQNLIKLFKTKSYDMLPIFTLVVGFFTTLTFVFNIWHIL